MKRSLVISYNAIVSCSGLQSNHNRAIALMATRNGWKCHLCIHGTRKSFLSEKGNALIDHLSMAECEFTLSKRYCKSIE